MTQNAELMGFAENSCFKCVSCVQVYNGKHEHDEKKMEGIKKMPNCKSKDGKQCFNTNDDYFRLSWAIFHRFMQNDVGSWALEQVYEFGH